MHIGVAPRCSWAGCLAKVSRWAWTLYDEQSNPVARSEDAWDSWQTAAKKARAFRQLIGHREIRIKIHGKPPAPRRRNQKRGA